MSAAHPKVTVNCPVTTADPVAQRNMAAIEAFFSCYLIDKPRFYSLWVEDDPEVITPFAAEGVAVCHYTRHSGWDAVKAFWDPIHDEMSGRFDWFIEEVIFGTDPNVIVTKTSSAVDVQCGAVWGNRHVAYNGRYIQIFKFEDGRIRSFEEYYDTARLNAAYSA